ncbi:hypothetical protein BGZ80_003823 [Entomortierella chlamydospora]|uniref:Uncharacterized protein n=1 Tax=Entomortierella chlamydospora TaxID=101097 RepID=A0A9P6SW97_9FUNG|nr:hypothetical protein BGZ80_003823 [Entomortierella chlamydospora]
MVQRCQELEATHDWPIKKYLSGSVEVRKSCIAWIPTAKAYAHGWPVLHISNTNVLEDSKIDEKAAIEIRRRFLALSRDVLTAEELCCLDNLENATEHLMVSSASYTLMNLLQQKG